MKPADGGQGAGMSFSLDRIVPWGRSFEEYVAMFALDHEDLGKRILGCANLPGFVRLMEKIMDGRGTRPFFPCHTLCRSTKTV